MLKTIRVYGRLARFLGQRVFEASVSSAAEAVRFLLANFPHLEPELSHGHYRVTADRYQLGEDELHHPFGQEIRIIPVVAGAGVVGRIVAGVALVALSFILAPVVAPWVASAALGIGTSLVLGGVAQLLTPVPRAPKASGTDSEKDPRRSYSFSGVQNTSRQGVPVPIVYGEAYVGSVVISAGIDTVQVTG